MNDWLSINILEALGIFFLCGYFGGRFANWLKFPRVTGYIIAGILLSPSISAIILAVLIWGKLSIITDIALAIIAYSIGGSLKLSRLKQLGKSIVWISVTQSLGSFVVTFILMGTLGALIVKFTLPHASWLQVYLPLALIIGAVSSATAPAAILAIVHEFQARGPLTTTLLGVVALDDGMAIILYAFASSIVGALVRLQGISIIHTGRRIPAGNCRFRSFRRYFWLLLNAFGCLGEKKGIPAGPHSGKHPVLCRHRRPAETFPSLG